jgi:ketosteroid isomerase-like protein
LEPLSKHNTGTEIDALLDRFFGSLEAGNVEGALACYAPDCGIWHNFDQITMDLSENARQLRAYFSDFPTRRYLEVRRHHSPGSVVQQHVLRLIRADGRDFDWPGCIVFEIRDEHIVALKEYVDLSSFLTRMT